MKKLSLLLVPLALCACSQDWSSGLEASRQHVEASLDATGARHAPMSAPTPAMAGSASTFANFPDRGALAHYDSKIPPRQTGAYTWHAADLSEEHAFHAIAAGEMTFEAPDGTPIKLSYQRHIEHPDGNWSWVGEAKDGSGQSAVITFGQDAVFGTIPQGNGQPPLRLTLSDGRAWVVSTDKKMLGDIRNEATHPTGPDFLVPPRNTSPVVGAANKAMALANAPVSAEAGANGNTVIDVLVGYTNGFAAGKGSQSAAVTRVRNLVDITNQAYVTSEINAELRLVHSMQVTFQDNTDNEDALEKLTGFKAPSTSTTPDPAFSSLRQARETYGADLVVLVRKFNDPENDGCGVAWLLGGGMSGITQSDEYFGYSVVSDGQDQGTDGKTYFCREETFAHEIGHNLGSQHDVETSKDEDGEPQPGAYSYSYGLNTGSAQGNFYTIMAYGESTQNTFRVFSNPRITACGGRACGTLTADNARSINNTAATIASFRQAVMPSKSAVKDDFNGDGSADVLWRNSVGNNAVWLGANASTKYHVSSVSSPWYLAAVADFSGDGKTDILWRNSAGNNIIWLAGNANAKKYVTSVGTSWGVAAAADFNGDGRADILWRNTAGNNAIWLSADATTQQSISSVATYWRVAGVGDFDADGRADILWRNSGGGNVIWLSGNAKTQRHVSSVATYWKVAGIGDFNGDGASDILWRSAGQHNAIWLSGNAGDQQYVSSVATYWQVAAVDDFDADGRSDILWRSTGGTNIIWRAGNASNQMTMSSLSTDWEVFSGQAL